MAYHTEQQTEGRGEETWGEEEETGGSHEGRISTCCHPTPIMGQTTTPQHPTSTIINSKHLKLW